MLFVSSKQIPGHQAQDQQVSIALVSCQAKSNCFCRFAAALLLLLLCCCYYYWDWNLTIAPNNKTTGHQQLGQTASQAHRQQLSNFTAAHRHHQGTGLINLLPHHRQLYSKQHHQVQAILGCIRSATAPTVNKSDNNWQLPPPKAPGQQQQQQQTTNKSISWVNNCHHPQQHRRSSDRWLTNKSSSKAVRHLLRQQLLSDCCWLSTTANYPGTTIASAAAAGCWIILLLPAAAIIIQDYYYI